MCLSVYIQLIHQQINHVATIFISSQYTTIYATLKQFLLVYPANPQMYKPCSNKDYIQLINQYMCHQPVYLSVEPMYLAAFGMSDVDFITP